MPIPIMRHATATIGKHHMLNSPVKHGFELVVDQPEYHLASNRASHPWNHCRHGDSAGIDQGGTDEIGPGEEVEYAEDDKWNLEVLDTSFQESCPGGQLPAGKAFGKKIFHGRTQDHGP